MNTWWRATIVAGGLAALPLTFDAAAGGVKANNACAQYEQGGSCCIETGATCYPNSCSSSSCSESGRYWKSDGKC